ncbi:Imm32 family immunity protein [Prauserella cavernicola]|uniref:Uncharacterized protein n=1 Tax=Prauserella cavernicola TaxID=2800127 RepID=A0A934QWJ9_9PSEU|nr:hypothetical protein [Prauserella cavernicola]MBK1786623.1 hypothetical protein [Prauserella cavernicola]
MKLVRDPGSDEVELTASADELTRLADAVADGAGLLGSAAPPDDGAARAIEVGTTPGPGVLVYLDSERRVLVISGDDAARAVLADNLRAVASAEDGGHLHLDHYPGHFYLAEGSVPVVVTSPHGGMPAR